VPPMLLRGPGSETGVNRVRAWRGERPRCGPGPASLSHIHACTPAFCGWSTCLCSSACVDPVPIESSVRPMLADRACNCTARRSGRTQQGLCAEGTIARARAYSDCVATWACRGPARSTRAGRTSASPCSCTPVRPASRSLSLGRSRPLHGRLLKHAGSPTHLPPCAGNSKPACAYIDVAPVVAGERLVPGFWLTRSTPG